MSGTITAVRIGVATPQEMANPHLNKWSKLKNSELWIGLQESELPKMKNDKSSYFLSTEIPLLLLEWMDKHPEVKYEKDLLIRLPCKGFDRVHVVKKEFIQEIFKYSRNGELFVPARTIKAIEFFLNQCFPGTNSEDIILSCEFKKTRLFHELLRKILQPKCVKEYLAAIKSECETSFNEVKDNETVNVLQMARDFFTRSFGTNILNDPKSGKDLSTHLESFKRLMSKQACGIVDPGDASLMEKLVNATRESISKILVKNPDLFIVDESKGEKPLDEKAKACLLFLSFFGAVDNTTTLLSILMLLLAKNPEKQAILRKACQEFQKTPQQQYPNELNDFFLEALQKHSPVPGVARIAAEDLCLEYEPIPIIF